MREKVVVEEGEEQLLRVDEEEEDEVDLAGANITNNAGDSASSRKEKEKQDGNRRSRTRSKKSMVQLQIGKKQEDDKDDARFLGESVPVDEARRLWPRRYERFLKVVFLFSSAFF